MNRENTNLILSAGILMLAAAFTRLFPHPPNFTAIGAIALFGGMVVENKKLSFILPLGALLISDICLQLFTSIKGFYGVDQFFVYGAFIVITALAQLVNKKSASNIMFAALWSGLVFFIISNMGVWISSSFYSKDISGLIACFAASLPFYKNEFFGNFLLNLIMGNVFYTAILFGAYALIQKISTAKASYL